MASIDTIQEKTEQQNRTQPNFSGASSHSILKLVDAETLKQWIDQDAVTLVDVREPSEYAAEHISGAVLVPLSRFSPAQIPVVKDKKLVLYCRSGNRSGQAAQRLFQAGFQDVTHLSCGLSDWAEKGLPLNIDKTAPISLMRQVQIVAGSLMLTGTVLGALVSPWFLLLSGFVGAGLVFAGVTDTCAMAMLLAKLPYNQRSQR
ncbi:MAG: rhodanese-like domain-containing protein [Thermosynechococcaceae cyanobacterium MS004]|nr:rhodanese-like domain-containing protein [Thermosynechococcaceae cyanobacterium MS004]